MAVTSFKLKHFSQIVASALNWLGSAQHRITDFNIGSVARTMIESVAMEIEEMYYRMFDSLEREIPNSAYESFGFDRLPATHAVGAVTFARSTPADQDYVIAAGTVVSTDELVTFATIEAVTLETGLMSVQATVQASVSGAEGNVQAGAITRMNSAIAGIETVTNMVAITGGAPRETDEERAARFRLFVEALPRTTIGGIVSGAMTARLVDGTGAILERVRLARADEPWRRGDGPRGVAHVYIDNGTGAASSGLVQAAQRVIDGSAFGEEPVEDGYWAAGIEVTVVAVTGVPVPVTVQVTAQRGWETAAVGAQVQATISRVFQDLPIAGALDWERLLASIMTTAGVHTATLTAPAADVTPTIGERLIAGAVSVAVSAP